MPWARIDDVFDDHPKVLAVLDHENGLAAVGLWTLCLTWAHRNTRQKGKTPGLLPAHLPRRFAGPQARELASVLEQERLWDRQPRGGWMIHDFHVYLPTEELSQKRSAAGKNGAAARWGTRGVSAGADSNLPSKNGNMDAFANGKPMANGVSEPAGRGAPSETLWDEPEHGNLASADSKLPSNNGNPMASRWHPDGNGMAIPSTHTHSSDTPDGVSGAGKPHRRRSADTEPNVGQVVGAFVDGATEAGQPPPAASLRARVGKQARTLMAEGYPVQTLIESAKRMGAGEWNDLAIQVRKDAAALSPAPGANGSRNPMAEAQALKEQARRLREGGNTPQNVIPGSVIRD